MKARPVSICIVAKDSDAPKKKVKPHEMNKAEARRVMKMALNLADYLKEAYGICICLHSELEKMDL